MAGFQLVDAMAENEQPISSDSPNDPSKTPTWQDEIRRCAEAVRDLSEDDIATLHSYAALKMVAIRGMVMSADAKDLLQEGVTRTLDGRRKWNPKQVDFVGHLLGCMRSIASELAKRARLELEAVEEFERNRRMKEFDDHWPTQILDQIRLRLQDDEIAIQVFEKLREGNKRAEICQALYMRADVYDAARKRISRCLYALVRDWDRKKVLLRDKLHNKRKNPGGQHA
jgi:hypothetical protein